jgi:hypothetical protein
MNSPKSPSTAPEESPLTGEAVVAAYLAQELPKARQGLKRTHIIGTILIILVGAYIGIISTVMVRFFEPKAASEVASGMLAQHVLSDGPIFAAQIEREIPLIIRQTPDYLIGELPVYRRELQLSLETGYEAYCNSLGKDLGSQIDKLIDDHQAEIKTLLENASDRDTIQKTLPDFDKMVATCMKNDPEGKALREHIDAWAVALKEVEKRMDHLANGSNLTPEEQKARHALALLSKVIQDNTNQAEAIELSGHVAKPKPAQAKPAKTKP